MADNFYATYPVSGGTGVSSLDSMTGDITLVAGTGISIADGTQTITITNTQAALTLTAVGSSPNANAATLTGQALNLEPASASFPGVVTTGTQSFAGAKTFTGAISASNLSGTNTGDVTLGTANGLSLASQALSLGLSSTSTTGALSSTDWNTFNGKQATLTFGNLTDVGTDGIVITGGTGSVIGTGASIAQHVADSTHNGYLSSTDWSTFNGKQASGNYITALTGDATASGPGSAALTLATVNSNVGSFTYATITVNGKGLVTAASSGTAPVTTLGAVGASPNANGASITTNTLNLQPFDTSNPGVVTASGGGSTNFLRADGSWAVPAGNGGFTYPTTGSSYGGTNTTSTFTGTNNIVIGQSAGSALTSGGSNVVIGQAAGGASLTSQSNTVTIGNAAVVTTGANEVVIGSSAASSNTGGNTVIIGQGATAPSSSTAGSIAIGHSAAATGASVAIGNSVSTAAGLIAIGQTITTAAANTIVLGKNLAAGNTSCFIVGNGISGNFAVTDASNQISFGAYNGSSGLSMKDMYLGYGAVQVAGAPNISCTIRPTPAVGTNIAGYDMGLYAGTGTGSGGGGSINFQTSPAAGSSSTANTYATVGSFSNAGVFTMGAASTTPAHRINGTLGFNGSSSGVVTVATQAAAGTYNFNLPITAGSAGQVLTSQAGGSNAMTWTTPSAAAGNYAVTSQTTTYAILTTDNLVLCSGSAFTVTLPTAVGVTGKIYIIKKTDSSLTNIITIATTSSQTLDGNSSLTLNTDQEQYTVVSDGANWSIIDHRWNMSPSTSVATTVTAVTTNPTKPTTAGLIDQDSMVWWRDTAKTVIVEYRYNQHGSTGGTTGSGNYLWLIPFTVDTTNISVYTGALSQSMSNNSILGNGNTFDSGSASDAYLAAVLYDSTHFRMQRASLGGAFLYAGSTGMAFNATILTYWVRIRVPVSGWSP